MAHLIRPWVVEYRKAVYLDGTGREVAKEAAGARKGFRRVPKGTPGAKKVRYRAGKWYGQGIPGMPPKKRVPLCSDKRAASTDTNRLRRGPPIIRNSQSRPPRSPPGNKS